MNVPIGIVACVVVLLALRGFVFHERRRFATWKALYHDLLESFDYIGLVLLMGGTICVLLGFSVEVFDNTGSC